MTENAQFSKHGMAITRYRALLCALTASTVLSVAAVLGALGSVAFAQTPAAPPSPPPPISSEPQVTTAAYADWILRCQHANDAPQATRQCEVAQTVQAQQNTILQMAFARANAKRPFRLVVIVPANVSFPSAVRVSINDKDPSPIDLTWRNCTSGGCAAEANITEEVLKQWRAQTEHGRVQIKDAAGRDATIPFSFRGLAQALDALARG